MHPSLLPTGCPLRNVSWVLLPWDEWVRSRGRSNALIFFIDIAPRMIPILMHYPDYKYTFFLAVFRKINLENLFIYFANVWQWWCWVHKVIWRMITISLCNMSPSLLLLLSCSGKASRLACSRRLWGFERRMEKWTCLHYEAATSWIKTARNARWIMPETPGE